MTSTANFAPLAKVDDVLITAELADRPSRAKDYESESRALGLLAQEMVTDPTKVLQRCAELALELCGADSAGISILEPDRETDMLRWHAAAGAFEPHLHGTMPADASPCGTVIERDCILLFNEAERFFPALHGVEPRIYENLLAPWHVKGKAAGTLWAIKHTPEGRFDAEDARVLQSLARFAAAAFQMISALDEAAAERSTLSESERKYRSLFEEMDEGFALCELVRDDDGRAVDFRYVELNPAVRRHTGIDPSILQGQLATEVFPERDPWYVETYARVVATGQSVLEDHYFAHVDRWLRISVLPRGGDRFAVLYSDVSERKRDEAKLRASEERQAFLLRFTDAIRSERNEVALIERAVQMLGKELDVDRAYATRHNPTDDLTNVIYEARRPDLAPLPATLRFSDFPEAGRQTFERTLVFNDTATDTALTEFDKAALAAMSVGALLSRPLRRDGSPLFALGVVSTRPRRWTLSEIALVEEATERTWEAAERVRGEAALRDSEERQRALIEGVPQLVWRASDPGRWTWASPQWTQFTGQREEDSLDWGWLETVHADDRERARAAWSQAIEKRHFEAEYRIRAQQTGEYRWFQTRATPIIDEAGRIVEWLGTSTDVDDLRRLQERQQVLLAELQHRVRNILAVTRSMISRSADGERSTQEYVSHLQGRIAALARTQVLLTRTAGSNVDLESLVRDEVIAQAAMDDQVSLVGEEVALSPKTAEVLTLALHELATNATKYGAFSRASGRLEVSWHVENRENQRWLIFIWQERGVPIIEALPRRQGFGSELITRRIPYELGGVANIEMKPGGIESRIEFPLVIGESILQTDARGR